MSAKPQRVKSIEVNTASLTIFYLEEPNSFYNFDKSGYWVVFKDGDLYEKYWSESLLEASKTYNEFYRMLKSN